MTEEGSEFVHELADVLEAAVDAGETDVGDLVEAPKRLDHHLADFFRRHFPDLTAGDGAFNRVDDPDEIGTGYGPLLAGPEQAVEEFFPVEELSAAVAFDDGDRDLVDPFVGREPAGAAGTLPAPPDLVTFADVPGIENPGFRAAAEGTLHGLVSVSFSGESDSPKRGIQMRPIRVMG